MGGGGRLGLDFEPNLMKKAKKKAKRESNGRYCEHSTPIQFWALIHQQALLIRLHSLFHGNSHFTQAYNGQALYLNLGNGYFFVFFRGEP